MKSKCQTILMPCFVILMILTISCNNQSQSNAEVNLVHQNSSPIAREKTKSSWLRYTSGVRSILEDSKGNVWFGSHKEGLCMLHDGKFEYFTTANGLSDNQVRNIYEDKNGIVWFECGRGLSTYNGEQLAVYKERNYDAKSNRELKKSDLWFKADKMEGYSELEKNPGAYQYDGKKLYYRQFPVTPRPEDGFKYYISTPFFKGQNGIVWLGTYGALIEFNGLNYQILDNQALGLTPKTGSLHVRSIIQDSKGNLWIGNNGIGVLKYDGRKVVNFTTEQKLKKTDTKGNSLEKIFSLAEDSEGNIWFGTVGSGVWRYDGDSIKNFTKGDGLSSHHIWTIYKSKQGNLWFGGANPSGVYQFDGKSFERKY